MLNFIIYTFAQNELNMIDSLKIKNDISILNKKIVKLLKKESPTSDKQKFKIFYEFFMNYNCKFKKDDFLNGSFINNLNPCYFTQKHLFKKRKYLETSAYICDSAGNLIAISNGRFISLTKNYNYNFGLEESEKIKLYLEKNYNFIFHIKYTPIHILFGIKDDEIDVLKKTNNILTVYSLKDYINCYWEDFSVRFKK